MSDFWGVLTGLPQSCRGCWGMDLISYTRVLVCPVYVAAMWLGCLAWKKGQRASRVPFKGGE